MKLLFSLLTLVSCAAPAAAGEIDFNRDIRPILSNKCFTCHGPDTEARQASLRLDSFAGATGETDSGDAAITPGDPGKSELIRRITTDDVDERMPPAEFGKSLSAAEKETLTRWIREGAPYAKHWSYNPPQRPATPDPLASVTPPQSADAKALAAWPRNDIDRFLLRNMLKVGLTPNPEADRTTLIRRLSLDLTGLPPTLKEVESFVNDADPQAYEKLIDRLLAKEAYGEHWARIWLDLARYADSAGYADDPARTIWAYRDWVIRALNNNQPFDQFTIDQIAGDLLPSPTDEQLVATAFHRNTLTNNEGGTNNEEFRNVAVVDRVNTTMAVWMGSTIACAQCHNHKYDPISQIDYFRFFAVFNNTQDADLRDEKPLLEVWTPEQEKQKTVWAVEIAALEQTLSTATPELAAAEAKWKERMSAEPQWFDILPAAVTLQSNNLANITDDAVLIPKPADTDVYTIDIPLTAVAKAGQPIAALQLETLAQADLPGQGAGHAGGNFVVTGLKASIVPPKGERPSGRFVRIENTGKGLFLSLAEVQVMQGADNIALKGAATQSSTDFGGPPALAIDGNTNGDYHQGKSVTHSKAEDNPWWEVDLKSSQAIDQIVLWNRTDNKLHTRLNNFQITLLDENRETVWTKTVVESPNPSGTYALSGVRGVAFAGATADYAQPEFPPTNVLKSDENGWAVGPQLAASHRLTLTAAKPFTAPADSVLRVVIEQKSKHLKHVLGAFRIRLTTDPQAVEFASIPTEIQRLLRGGPRDGKAQAMMSEYYRSIAPALKKDRDRLAAIKKQLASAKPTTTVPIMRELAADKQRETHLQHRGNYLQKGEKVTPGVPGELFAPPATENLDRLAVAQWLVDERNPLTSRVIVNRYWEGIFGRGIVLTSEEFGSQGEAPTHPELLDYLATEFIRLKWDRKALLKQLVTTAAYRQASTVTPEAYEQDPDNAFLARGPRFRLSAEMIRDQALAVSGLLSDKMYGPPVKPPQPSIGLSAAFGSGIDWKTSEGDDKHRRGLYTTWRRSNPYPSMSTFDAPNREVCTLRRDRTNTPLQALVTLNDPVYIEAAQALGRRMSSHPGETTDQIAYGFRLCVARSPNDAELKQLATLYSSVQGRLQENPQAAMKLATDPIGPLPQDASAVDLAAWTVVGNVLLNLDEMFMKR